MRKQIAKDFSGDIDLRELEKAAKTEVNSVASMVLTVRDSRIMDTLPEWIRYYPVPADTRPCDTLDPFQCYCRLIKIQKEKGISIHPANQIDMLLASSNVTVSPAAVSYQDGEKVKTIETVVGYLMPETNDVERLCHASTADLFVTDAKYTKAKVIAAPEWPEQFSVPISEAVRYRHLSGSVTPGRSKPRDEIFTYLSRPTHSMVCTRMHTLLGDKLPNFTEIEGLDEVVKAAYKKKKMTVPPGFKCKIIGIDGSSIPYTESLEDAYRMYFKSIGIRGGREGKNVSHGFERFSMTCTNARMMNMVTDMRNMLRKYKANTLQITAKCFTAEELKVLVANGISIVCPEYPYGVQNLDVPGVYGKPHEKAEIVEYFRIEEDWIKPELITKKEKDSPIKFGQYYDNAINMMLERQNCFSYIYIDTRLASYKTSLSFLPSATADTMKIIIGTGLGVTYPLPKLIKRATLAISCRNRYVHLRKPFCAVDTMASFVNWNETIVLPKLQVRDHKKVVQIELFREEVKYAVVAPTVDVGKIKNKMDQEQETQLVGLDLIRAAYKHDGIKLFKIIAGIGEEWPAKYLGCDEVDEEWMEQFGSLLDETEISLKSLLRTMNPDICVDYMAKKEEIQLEFVMNGGDDGEEQENVAADPPPVVEEEEPPPAPVIENDDVKIQFDFAKAKRKKEDKKKNKNK